MRPRKARVRLRQVITERREDHVVDSVGLATYAGPGIASEVGVVGAEPEAAFRAVVELVPKSGRSFGQDPSISGAISESAGSESTGTRTDFGPATGIAECRSAVANHGTSARLGQRIEAGRTAGILDTAVPEEVELLGYVNLKRGQAHEILDEMQSAISVDGSVWEAAGTVASHTAAAETFEANYELLCDIEASTGADSAALFRGVVGAEG